MYHCHTTRAAVSILLAASCMAQCEEPSAGQQYIQTPCSAEMATQLAECAADVPENSYVKRACIPGTNGLEGADGWVAGAAGSDTEIVACLGTVAAGWYVEQACSRGGPQRKGSDTKIAKCSSPGASQWVSAACEAGDVGSKGSDTAFQPCGSSAEVEGRSRSLVAFDVEGNCTSRSCVQDECCAVPQLCADSPFNSDSSCRAAPGNTSLTLFDEGGYCDGETCQKDECCKSPQLCAQSPYSSDTGCGAVSAKNRVADMCWQHENWAKERLACGDVNEACWQSSDTLAGLSAPSRGG